MKYIITDKNEACVGGMYHSDMAEGLDGKVIRAGHCEKTEDGYRVWGSSIGYGINAQPEDAEILNKLLQ